MARNRRAGTLARVDWDFDGIAQDELLGCCYWEYARESTFIRETLRRYRDNWCCPGDKSADSLLKNDRCLERIQSIGYAAAVFISGCAFKPDTTYQSNYPSKANYRHPDAPPITGSFPAAWQSLTEAEQKYRAHIGSDVERLQIVPIKLGHWSLAKEIARKGQMIADLQHEQRRAWERGYLRRDEKGNFFTLPGAGDPPDMGPIRPAVRWGLGETLMVEIVWDCFTNDEIANYFRRWVKHNRPREIPVPSGQGRKRISDRVKLERLAIMRLLHRFTFAELRAACPDAWKRYNTPNRRWRKDVYKAHAHFRELFPFLPEDELPLSWVP